MLLMLAPRMITTVNTRMIEMRGHLIRCVGCNRTFKQSDYYNYISGNLLCEKCLKEKGVSMLKKIFIGTRRLVIKSGVTKEFKIFLVDRNDVTKIDPEFAIGAHHWVTKEIPEDEIWIEDHLTGYDREVIIEHELKEIYHMLLGLNYDQAHVLATQYEMKARENWENWIKDYDTLEKIKKLIENEAHLERSLYNSLILADEYVRQMKGIGILIHKIDVRTTVPEVPIPPSVPVVEIQTGQISEFDMLQAELKAREKKSFALQKEMELEPTADKTSIKAQIEKNDARVKELTKRLMEIQKEEEEKKKSPAPPSKPTPPPQTPPETAGKVYAGTVYEAGSALMSVCDGAKEIDGHGYNKFDTKTAKIILASERNAENEFYLYNILRKYNKQLVQFGMPHADLKFEYFDPQKKAEEKKKREAQRKANKDKEMTVVYGEKTNEKGSVFGRIHVYLPFDMREKFGLKYDPESKKTIKTGVFSFIGSDKDSDGAWFTYIVPRSVEELETLSNLLENEKFDVNDEAQKYLDSLYDKYYGAEIEKIRNLKMSSKAIGGSDTVGLGLLREPFPFQRVGIDFAVKNKKCLIADDMGLGKSIQSIVAVHRLEAYPCLVVSPASVKYNWREEVNKTLGDKYTVSIVEGKKPISDDDKYKTHFVLCNYDILKDHVDDFKKFSFKSVIFDESHYARNYDSKRTKASQDISKGIEYRFLLSGTPIVNRPREMISQLIIAGRFHQKIFGSVKDFLNKYCGPKSVQIRTPQGKRTITTYDGATNVEELNLHLRENGIMIRRLKLDVLKELPPKQIIDISVDIDNRAEYDKAKKSLEQHFEKEFREKYKDISEEEFKQKFEVSKEDYISAMVAEAIVSAGKAAKLTEISRLRDMVSRGKLSAVMEWVQNFLETTDRKLVIYAVHDKFIQDLYDQIKKLEVMKDYQNIPIIRGGVANEKRFELVKQFQTDPMTRVFIANITAGAEGITLTAASDLMFAELYWTPGKHLQTEDRIHRISQREQVTIYYLLATDTIDDYMMDIIKSKHSVIQGATGTIKVDDTDEELIKQLAEAIKQRKFKEAEKLSKESGITKKREVIKQATQHTHETKETYDENKEIDKVV